jgi:hypothetical protein
MVIRIFKDKLLIDETVFDSCKNVLDICQAYSTGKLALNTHLDIKKMHKQLFSFTKITGKDLTKNSSVQRVSQHDNEWSCTHDCESGNYIGHELNVEYC